MWDSPSWVGNLISGKISSSIAEANRENDAAIATANRASQAAIAEANRANEYLIASERNSANIKIAEISAETERLNRESRETIAQQDRESREAIAEAQRTNDYSIAQMKSGIDFLNTGVRTVLPFALPFAFSAMSNKSNGNNNNDNSGPIINANTGSVSAKEPKTTKDKAREKAESLFPDLEPTWSSSVDGRLPTINNKSFGSNVMNAFKSSVAAFGAAVLTGVTLAPIITI